LELDANRIIANTFGKTLAVTGMQVDGVSCKEFISVLNRLIASPVKFKHFAVSIQHRVVNPAKVLVLHHGFHNLRKECRVIVVEQMQPHA
jgi:hypothetical protein